MFELIFSVLAQASQSLVHWPYIHGTEQGLRTIGLDMCNKQAGGMLCIFLEEARLTSYIGLGDYLHDIDPTREWDEHLQHLLVFCRVHLKRNFMKRFGNHEARHIVLNKIFGPDSREEILENMRSICQMYPELTRWVNHKKPRWLMSGLAQSESKVPIEYFTIARKHTGLSESSHFQENHRIGRKISMLHACLS